MTEIKKLIIGTRGSKLALVQTELVAEALRKVYPGIAIENKIITTKGDINQAPIPLDTVGKTWFTEEIEQALLVGEIDFAVHSLKDLPPDLPEGLIVMPVLARADAADVFISKSGENLKNIKMNAVVGTDSARRRAFLLASRPDLVVKSIRGNVDTRLKKLESEEYDAIVIAAAGLARLNIQERITERLDPKVFVPAPGQGILAVEMKKERVELADTIGAIVHVPTAAAAEVEQAFSRAIGGGCKLPVGCYAEINDQQVEIYAGVGTADGENMVRKTKRASLHEGIARAEELAKEF